MENRGHVLGADHLGAAARGFVLRMAVVHPFGIDGELAAADVDDEGSVRLGQPRPDRIMRGMPRRAAARIGRNHEQPQAFGQRAIEFGRRALRILEHHQADADQPRIIGDECPHRAIECAHAAIADVEILASEHHARRE